VRAEGRRPGGEAVGAMLRQLLRHNETWLIPEVSRKVSKSALIAAVPFGICGLCC